jgi:hypothetical protein
MRRLHAPALRSRGFDAMSAESSCRRDDGLARVLFEHHLDRLPGHHLDLLVDLASIEAQALLVS